MLRVLVLACLAFISFTDPASTQTWDDLPNWAKRTHEPSRRALVIGVGDYAHTEDLATPPHDERLMRDAFTRLKFNVSTPRAGDRSRDAILDAISALAAASREGDVAVVYFAGHGIQRDGLNYLIPADANLAEPGREPFVYVSLDHILDVLTQARVAVAVVILDACRVDPYVSVSAAATIPAAEIVEPTFDPTPAPRAGRRASTRASTPSTPTIVGLAQVNITRSGLMIGYAAAPGRPSYSRLRGESPELGSLYTRALIAQATGYVGSPNRVFNRASSDVLSRTNGQQAPWLNELATPDFRLLPDAAFVEEQKEAWILAVAHTDEARLVDNLLTYLRYYPVSDHAFTAREEIRRRSFLTMVAERSNWILAQVARPFARASLYYHGAIASPTLDRDSNNRRAFAAERLEVYEPRMLPIGPRRVIGTIEAGAEVNIVDYNPNRSVAEIDLGDGRVGLIDRVYRFGLTPTAPQEVRFQGEGAAAQMTDTSQLDALALRTRAEAGPVTVRVGVASFDDPGRAQQLSYLRALRLRAELVARGVDPARINLEVAQQDVSANAAQVTLSSEARQ